MGLNISTVRDLWRVAVNLADIEHGKGCPRGFDEPGACTCGLAAFVYALWHVDLVESRQQVNGVLVPPTLDQSVQHLIDQVRELVAAYHEQAAAFARLTERIDQLLMVEGRNLQ